MSAAMLPARARLRHQRLPQRLQVLEQQRVVEVVGVAPDLAHDLLAEAALGADAEVLGGRVAERGQVVLRRAAARPAAAAPQRTSPASRRFEREEDGLSSKCSEGQPVERPGPVRRYHARETFPECFLP